ncbi:MAG: hypothetical protein DMD64_02445, partial [Gemmatimonadetes bacterium]
MERQFRPDGRGTQHLRGQSQGALQSRCRQTPTTISNATEEQAMAKESVHKKLERIRPPRVNITYEVETGGAMEVRELPFVMGVLADFTGHP